VQLDLVEPGQRVALQVVALMPDVARAPDVVVKLEARSVSQFHFAELERSGQRFELVPQCHCVLEEFAQGAQAQKQAMRFGHRSQMAS
jgi:hypothetical protein